MCAGAIINARIRSLYFGAFDPRGGACGSVTDVFRLKELNHRVTVYAGIMEEECSLVLSGILLNPNAEPKMRYFSFSRSEG